MAQDSTIYLIDDDEASRRRVRGMLEGAGYLVQEGSDGRQALGMVRDGVPDLMLLDVEMPVMNGPQVCRIIKGSQGFPFFPIILITARDDMQTKVDALQLGADDYLVKPINQAELLARVKSMLRLKKLQDELLRANEDLKRMNQRLQEISTVDPLMGIYNRLYFEKRFRYEFQRASRYRSKLALLMLDIDHFKRVNDKLGHQFGDYALKECARLLLDSVRQVDIVARYGGEELVVACPETNLEQAMIVAERIRSRIEAHRFEFAGKTTPLTISIGIAVFPGEGIDSLDKLVTKADEALYRAKDKGRNTVSD